jgi:hypothetical protein
MSQEPDDPCPGCGGTSFAEREDDGGTYYVCRDCGRRQGGLGRLQDRLGI